MSSILKTNSLSLKYYESQSTSISSLDRPLVSIAFVILKIGNVVTAPRSQGLSVLEENPRQRHHEYCHEAEDTSCPANTDTVVHLYRKEWER